MLHAANTDLFDPLVPNDHNSECQYPPAISSTNYSGKSQLKLVRLRIFIFFTFTYGISKFLNFIQSSIGK